MANHDADFDIHRRTGLGFPQSLPDFQRLFPDEAACAGYLEKLRWPPSSSAKCNTCRVDALEFLGRAGDAIQVKHL